MYRVVSTLVSTNRQSDSRSLIQPMSMEDKARYVSRFAAHKGMTELFSNEAQRREIAGQIFSDRWEGALVTVRKLNGEMFFID